MYSHQQSIITHKESHFNNSISYVTNHVILNISMIYFSRTTKDNTSSVALP